MKITKKSWAGKPYVRLGPLFFSLGQWVYQQGAVLGYALRDNPNLLAKLIASTSTPVPVEQIITELHSLQATAAAVLQEESESPKTLLHLFTFRELRGLGLDIPKTPSIESLKQIAHQLDRKCDADFAGTVMRVSFIKGVAFGFHFPNEFIVYWANTYRIRPETEWQSYYAKGIVQSEYQQPQPLELAIAEISEGAIEWAATISPGSLNLQDIGQLRAIVAKDRTPR